MRPTHRLDALAQKVRRIDEAEDFWKDHKAAKLNAIHTRKAIQEADVVVVRFGEKYRQWNAAFAAEYASALGKSIIKSLNVFLKI